MKREDDYALSLSPHHSSASPFEYFDLLAQRNADAAVRWAQELTVCSNPQLPNEGVDHVEICDAR